MPHPLSEARSAPPLAVVTGATGFIGRHLVAALARAGWRVRLLLRRMPDEPSWHDLEPQVVAGSLDDAGALARLVDGADAVIHLAGLIKAARRAQFFAVNRDGAAALARAARAHAPDAHVMLVSSLAAREPALSDYAASKRAGETAVLDVLGARATVLRPPAVYGPGDRETLLIFQLARRRRLPLLAPPGARLAMLHVRDLAELIVARLRAEPRGEVIAAADGRPSGYDWSELLGAAARAVGNPSPSFLQVPGAVLGGVALIGDIARLAGTASMLNSQKLRELRHPDWTVTPAELAAPVGWTAKFDLDSGFADAVAWYRAAGWLR